MRELAMTLALMTLSAGQALADGCYTCGTGSSSACRDYCAFKGPDTFDNRHKCEAKGCRISGTSACPSGGDVRMCMSPAPRGAVVASLPPQCPPQKG